MCFCYSFRKILQTTLLEEFVNDIENVAVTQKI